MLRITGGRVYDPANGIDGVVKDICIADGKIVADVQEGRTIGAAGTAYRMDEVPLPLRPALGSPYPTDEEVIRRIRHAVEAKPVWSPASNARMAIA